MLSRSLSVGPELQRFCMCNFCSLQTSSQFQNSPGKCKWSEVRKHCTIYDWSNVKFTSPQNWRGTVTVQKVLIIITFGDSVKFNFQPNMDIGHAPHTTCISVNLSNYQVVKIVNRYYIHCPKLIIVTDHREVYLHVRIISTSTYQTYLHIYK